MKPVAPAPHHSGGVQNKPGMGLGSNQWNKEVITWHVVYTIVTVEMISEVI